MNEKDEEFFKNWIDLRKKEPHPKDLETAWKMAYSYKLNCESFIDFIDDMQKCLKDSNGSKIQICAVQSAMEKIVMQARKSK